MRTPPPLSSNAWETAAGYGLRNARPKDGGTVGVRVDVTELKERERELQKLAVTDYLTGISNRRVFLAELQSAFDKVKTNSLRPFSAAH